MLARSEEFLQVVAMETKSLIQCIISSRVVSPSWRQMRSIAHHTCKETNITPITPSVLAAPAPSLTRAGTWPSKKRSKIPQEITFKKQHRQIVRKAAMVYNRRGSSLRTQPKASSWINRTCQITWRPDNQTLGTPLTWAMQQTRICLVLQTEKENLIHREEQ